MGRLNRFIWFLIMIIIGGGAGLYYAWYVKPVEVVDAALYNLRADYKADYVLMAAEIFDETHNRYSTLLLLDRILDQGEDTADVVEAAISNAEKTGYDPIDLEKMYRLKEAVTGQRPTATPPFDPTTVYEIENGVTATVSAPAGSSVSTVESSGSSGLPQADSDPFGTGIQITTDPNAVPMLDLPMEPTITPRPEGAVSGNSGTSSSDSNTTGFSGIPEDFFDQR